MTTAALCTTLSNMELLNELCSWLVLDKPVTLTIKTRKGKDCDALYLPRYSDKTGKLIGHKVVIYTVGTTRSFETLLAHELIHAKQEEERLTEIHGDFFQQTALEIQSSFGIEEIYIDDVDEN